jgi:hypothetical protein
VTGPFTATLDLGGPFKVQTEPFALTKAVAAAQSPVPASGRGNAKAILIVLSVVIAGALAFTYRKRPAK